MPVLPLRHLPDPVLRQRTRRIRLNGVSVERFVDDMFETMHDSQGIGLAGPQVHESIKLFVAGVDDDDIEISPVVIINPEITLVGSRVEEDWEGCLSIPGIRARVPRSTDIRVRALDRHGEAISLNASGFPARVIQHEADHLDGVLFFDRMNTFDSLTFLEEYSRYWAKTQKE